MSDQIQNQATSALALAPGSALHRCARIRSGLYNYRAYNIRRYPRGWAVRGEDDKHFGPFAKRLRDICGIIDLWERRGPNSFTSDGWRLMSPETQVALAEMVRRVTKPNTVVSDDAKRRSL